MRLFGIETIGSPAAWLGFLALVGAMLALDLGVFHRREHEISAREAVTWSLVWISLAALFGLVIFFRFGSERALEYATGYLIEKALAVDNIFVFVVVFSTFSVPARYQHRVLFWGVAGALFMRALFILAGGVLLARFHFTLYVFGALLVLTGVRLLRQGPSEPDPSRNPIFRALRRVLPVTAEYHGKNFFAREDGSEGGRERGVGSWRATPLLLALVALEITDVIFALDSIPAIFAVTRDPFIVFTSNIFAILGLRSLYFLLARVIHRFRHLKVGLALVLVFVGGKMLLADVFEVPVLLSLAVIALVIGGAVVTSLLAERRRPRELRRA
jgi:tellurite resistance protein TerC